MRTTVVFLFILTALTACSGSQTGLGAGTPGNGTDSSESKALAAGDALTAFGLSARVVTSNTLEGSSSSLSGSGAVVFAQSLESIDSQKNFSLTVSLEDAGSAALVANAGTDLTGGIELVLTRSANTLNAVLRGPEGDRDVTSKFAALNASGTLMFSMDIHNNETPAHILVWDASKPESDPSYLLLDSEGDALETPGAGSGVFWGLRLSNARISGAGVGPAKEGH